MTFDRDPRWVGGVSGRDFPSPLRRLLLCLGVKPHVCPPHRPDKNAFVERFHRTYGQECLQVHQPATLQEVREVTEAFLQHDKNERPHQGRACGNVPPRVAFPTLPVLPALPERVNPDAWLGSLDQKRYLRHVGRDGCVDVDLATDLLPWPTAGWADGPAASKGRAAPVCRVVPGSDCQGDPHQRLGRTGDGAGRLFATHQARGIGGPATCFGPVVQESPTAVSVGRSRLLPSCSADFLTCLSPSAVKRGYLFAPLSDQSIGETEAIASLSRTSLRLLAHLPQTLQLCSL
jgi:hypothetical protein